MPLNENSLTPDECELLPELRKLHETAKAARDAGAKYYWNERKPRCKNGHLSSKYSSRWTCTMCVSGSPLPGLNVAERAEKAAAKAEKAAKAAAAKAEAKRIAAAKARADHERRAWMRAVKNDPTRAGAVGPEGDYSRLVKATEEWTETVPLVMEESGGGKMMFGRSRLATLVAQLLDGVNPGDVLRITDDATGEVIYDHERDRVVTVKVRPRRPVAEDTEAPKFDREASEERLARYQRMKDAALAGDGRAWHRATSGD